MIHSITEKRHTTFLVDIHGFSSGLRAGRHREELCTKIVRNKTRNLFFKDWHQFLRSHQVYHVRASHFSTKVKRQECFSDTVVLMISDNVSKNVENH